MLQLSCGDRECFELIVLTLHIQNLESHCWQVTLKVEIDPGEPLTKEPKDHLFRDRESEC